MAKYKPYLKYKDSGIAWIGDVPEGWGFSEVKWLYNRKKITNNQGKELLSVYRDYGVIPKSSRSDNHNKASEDLTPYQLVEKGDLVTNKMKAWQGSIAISNYEGIVSPAYYVYKAYHSENNQYLHYLFRSKPYILYYGVISKGIRVNQWDLEHEAFKLTQVITPPLPEQQAIATFLDRETAHIDKLISKKSRSIELLKEKRQATITQAVTKGLNPNVPMKDSGIEWIGDIPEEWRTLRVKNLSQKIKTGATPDIFAEERDNFISWYTPSNFTDSFELTENCKKVSPNTPKVITFQPETILVIGIGATLGKVALTQVPCFANQQINFIVPNKSKILPIFLTFALSSQLCQMKFVSNSSTLGIMNQEKTANIVICCPPLHKQQSIVDYLDVQCTKIDDLITKTESSIELLKEKRQALIAAAVTGKIDVREAVC